MAERVKELAEAFHRELMDGESSEKKNELLEIIGPAKAPVSRINDVYRYMIYAKSEEEAILLRLKDKIEKLEFDRRVLYQFDME